uniref:Uncharacterized protein n=1 Tax=uncultured Caudovirales phage TaxID=2100421 RepID=A0A6J5L5P3_9CAUD|nr:hypothetical protein UFOVP114_60 [uncultured Caudovirales phage]
MAFDGKRVELFSLWTPLLAGDDIESLIHKTVAAARLPPKDSGAYISRAANGNQGQPLLLPVGGIVSAEEKDQQGETVVQDGIDWSYHLKRGHLNYEHLQGPENVIGYPETVTKCVYKGVPASRMSGYLYGDDKRAREIYEKAITMRKAGGARHIGFSIEGATVERDKKDKKRILKSFILNTAVTAHPVYPDSRLETLARSLMVADGLYKSGAIGYQSPTQIAGGLSALVPQSLGNTVSSSTYGGKRKGSEVSLERLASLIAKCYPRLSASESVALARSLMLLSK